MKAPSISAWFALSLLLSVGCSSLRLRTDVRLIARQYSPVWTDFFLAPTEIAREIETTPNGVPQAFKVYGAKRPDDAWAYCIVVEGDSKISNKDKLTLFEPFPSPDPIDIDSGFIEVDRSRGTVRVELRITQREKTVPFKGNGIYSIPIQPNKAPEPTTTAVTPRAIE